MSLCWTSSTLVQDGFYIFFSLTLVGCKVNEKSYYSLPASYKHIGAAQITQITHVRNENSNIQGGNLMWQKLFSIPKGSALKKGFAPCGSGEQILSFKRSSTQLRESLPDPVVSL